MVIGPLKDVNTLEVMLNEHGAAKAGTIQSVERALGVLEVFFEDAGSVSVTEVAAKTGLAPATTHRVLATLVRMGWLEQDVRSSRYQLSEHLLGSAALALANSGLLREGRHFLSRISDATGLNSFLAVRRGRSSVLLARAQGRLGASSDFQVGKALPMHASASGKLFLAFLPEGERREILGLMDLKPLTSRTIIDREQLDIELQSVRELGFAADRNELYESYRSIAVPIRQADRRVVAALCAGWWAAPGAELDEESPKEAVLREMLPAAEEFSRIYGQFAW